MRIVKKIEPIKLPSFSTKKKVAAYARVSSAKESMLHSLAAQVGYYSQKIQSHPDWEYVGVYADEGITGTKKLRPELQRLLLDCRNKKIDMIITKSISRFARNTLALLEMVRELSSIGVDIYFEEQNIHSISSEGELMLTILASFAQEESLSISENCKWRIRKGFKEGKTNNMNMYGYRLKNNEVKIIAEEAEVVITIFKCYLEGMGKNAIMKQLNASGIVTRNQKAWTEEGIRRILKNERYMGDLLLQKTFVSDHLMKKRMENKGQFPKYYVKDNHPAIIDRETFLKVQEEISYRAKQTNRKSNNNSTYSFTSKITCGICGKKYRRRITNSTTKYNKPAWICSTFKQHGKQACRSKQIPEDKLIEIAKEITGLKELDPKETMEQVSTIKVMEGNLLQFSLCDGEKIERYWKKQGGVVDVN